MNIEAPVGKFVGRPTLIVTHADGSEESRTVTNAPLKKIFDAILAGTSFLSIYPIIKVGVGTTPTTASTSFMELPIKPAGANYNLNSTKSANVSPKVYSPDGKTLSYTYTYVQTFNLGAIVGLITEVGLDTRSKNNTGEVDFRAVLDSGVNVYADSQLKVFYAFDISVTIGAPFVMPISVGGVSTDFTITPTFMQGTTLDINQILTPPSSVWVEDLDTIASGALWRSAQSMNVSSGHGVYEFIPDSSKIAVKFNSTGSKCNTTSATIKWIAFNDQRPLVGYKIEPPLPKSTLQALKLKVTFDYDAVNPWYDSPLPPDPVDPPEDTPDVIPMDLVDTADTGHTLESLGQYGLDYPNQIVRANDELEIMFYAGAPSFKDNSHVAMEGKEAWVSSTLSSIGFGFGMWGLDPATDNMLARYNCYVELTDGATTKRAKLVINEDPTDPAFKWYTYAKETSPGMFSKTDYLTPEYSDFYNEYINDGGGLQYAFGSGLPAVDDTYYGTNPDALWLISIFYPNAAEWPVAISGRTLAFRMKAIPKNVAKTPVQLTMDVHFDIPKPVEPEVPAEGVDTVDTNRIWGASNFVDAAHMEVRNNDELELMFALNRGATGDNGSEPFAPTVKNGNTWTANGSASEMYLGFNMYQNFDITTQDITDRYDLYVDLLHSTGNKTAKYVRIVEETYPGLYLQCPDGQGGYSNDSLNAAEQGFYDTHEVNPTTINFAGFQENIMFIYPPNVGEPDPELNPVEFMARVVRTFYRSTGVVPFDLSNATIQIRLRAVPKDTAKATVQFTATVNLTA
jgi:hypothetical protein